MHVLLFYRIQYHLYNLFLIVLLFCFLFQDSILRYYLNDPSLSYVLKIGFIYLAIDGVATYISVIPRYTKKAKQYVVNNVSSILIRVLSTIFCVCVLNTGIVGVLYGHIIGTLSCLLLNAISHCSHHYALTAHNRLTHFAICRHTISGSTIRNFVVRLAEPFG